MEHDSEKKKSKGSELTKAREAFKSDKSHWNEIYKAARDDLFFQSDDPYAQWDSSDHAERTRTGRPAITIDMLGQFVHQTVNDVKQNTPTINIIPGGGEASQEAAEVYKGLIRNIEYASAADDAYDTALTYSVKCSIGWIRVDHDYVDDEGFDQELLIKRVMNPLSCWIDSESVEADGRDAKRATIIDKMKVADFKKKYPGKEVACFEELEDRDIAYEEDEMISIAEQFTIEEEPVTLALDAEGNQVDYEEGKEYNKTRQITKKKVVRRKMSGKDILEETTFPGKYIPLVPVYGEESWYNGKRSIHSLIRKSKEAQKMYNYWKSLETELLMKQPQAPVLTPAGAIEDFQDDWRNPNKSMALRYRHTDDDGNPLPKPERLAPPTIPTGVVNASRETVDDIKATMGLYNASLGQRSNETSGVAINQRKMEGDVATYHFGDNLTKSITQVGRILVCAIPEIYDTPRVLRIIGEEDEPKEIGVNGEYADGQENHIELRRGKYDVKVVAGASFTTRRQETVTAMSEMFQRMPDLMSIMGDIYFKNSDFTGAQAMAERMKKAIDPKFLEDEQGSEEGQQLQAMQQQYEAAIQAMQGEMQQMQAALEEKQSETQIKAMDVQTKQAQAESANQLKAMELQVKMRELELKEEVERMRFQLEAEKAEAELELEYEKMLQQADKDNIQMEQDAIEKSFDMQQKLAEANAQDMGSAPTYDSGE